ncbi:TRAP transporter substrate-binding protein [Roseomonas sp. HF4]|uniref:TRAP transporter substrate-binding protein n=1 Tax=Roseomonas sp. HF4 TaxID=2562313 RepID=UPI0010C0A40B|nr:TRAP transporter substrate-binding protein [Roseomonas sp. HF4]
MKTWIAAAAIGVMATSAAAQTLPETRVTVLGNIGITTQSRTIEAPFWNTQVRELSGGRITSNFRPWSEAGLRGPEVFRILARGQANIATAQLGHHAGDAAINDGNDLAGLTGSMAEFRRVTDAFRPALNAFYERQLGLVPLTYQSYQSQILYCRTALSGLADLRGRRVRTSGTSQGDFVAFFGGTPVDVAFGETQQALAQGTIDCAITGTLSGYVAKWYEATRFLYTLPINYGAGATVANGAWWRAQPQPVRDFLTTELKKLEDRMWALNAEEDSIGIACNTTGPCPLGAVGGMTRVDPSPADVQARRQAMLERVLPNWARRCGAECVAEWNRTVGPVVNLEARIPQ